MSQLLQLSKPFPESLIQTKPGKSAAQYVSHSSINERALATLGAFDLNVVREIYEPNGVLSGVILAVTVTIDGERVTITEAGEADNPQSKTNGARSKDAISDGIKRCFMRLGLGLHLWSGKDYVLHKVLARNEGAEKPVEPKQEAETSKEAQKPVEASPAKAEPPLEVLGEERGKKMEGHVRGMGFADNQFPILCQWVIQERDVATFAELTDPEAKQVIAEAKRIVSEREKPPFEVKAEEPENFAPNGPGSRLLTNTEAANLHKALGAFGIKDHYAFASKVMGRKVNSLQASTVATSIKIYEAALEEFGDERQKAEWAERQERAAA